jgi:hypothetical protein
MPQRCAFVQLSLFVVGLVGFVGGEALEVRAVAFTGAALVALALLLFAVRLVIAMLRTGRAGRTARAFIVASVFLALTATFGVLLAGDPTFGWLGVRRAALVALHVHVALVGWVLLIVVAVAQRLLPMFLMTRAPDGRAASLSLVLVAAGAVALIAFHAAPPLLRVWLPLVLVASGLALFLWQSGRAFSQSGLSDLDPGMRFAGVSLVFFAVALLLAPFAFRFGYGDPQRLVLYVASAILAAGSLFVCGHYYRIIPFLVWSQRFAASPEGARIGPQGLYRRDLAILGLLCFVTGATGLLVSFGHGTPDGARGGAVAFLVGVVILAYQVVGVLRQFPAPVAPAPPPPALVA